MEFDQVIEKRRSIRKFKPDAPVRKEQLEEMLRAASKAPSWKNSQTSRYYIVLSPDMLQTIKTECLPDFNQRSAKDAPVLIVSAFVKDKAGFDNSGAPDNELGNGWGCYDLGIRDEHLALKAVDLGLDTLIMGIRDSARLRELLSIPQEQEIVSVIAVGYRDTDPSMPPRKDLNEFSFFF